jgi:Flp pilus assembly protein TadD
MHAVALDPHNAEAHNNLGILLGSQNRLKEAAMEFEQAVRIQPNDREAQRNLAVALQRIRSSPAP